MRIIDGTLALQINSFFRFIRPDFFCDCIFPSKNRSCSVQSNKLHFTYNVVSYILATFIWHALTNTTNLYIVAFILGPTTAIFWKECLQYKMSQKFIECRLLLHWTVVLFIKNLLHAIYSGSFGLISDIYHENCSMKWFFEHNRDLDIGKKRLFWIVRIVGVLIWQLVFVFGNTEFIVTQIAFSFYIHKHTQALAYWPPKYDITLEDYIKILIKP